MTSILTVRFGDLGWPVVAPIISRITGHWSNHVDLLTDGGQMVSALPGGVREWGLAELRLAQDETLSLPCTLEQRTAALAFARSQIGKGYDYAGVLCFSFAARWQDHHRWFCSELTTAALVHAGIIAAPKAWRVSPGALYRILKGSGEAPC